jgi:peptidoglycan hydrolase CwlO-like protein
MSQKAGVLTRLTIVLILVTVFSAAAGFYLFQKERLKNIELQQRIEDLTLEKKRIEAELKGSRQSISELQTRLQEAKSKIEALNNDLQQEKIAKLEAQERIEALNAELNQQEAIRADLEKKLTDAGDEIRKAQSRLKELDSEKIALESRLKELEIKSQQQRVELGTIVVSPEKPATLEGKVLVVNKDYNFVVINLGSKDGVSLGDAFSIYQDDQHIGEVKVEKVHEAMSAAGFVSDDIKDKVKEGDKVVQKVI